MLDLDIVDGDSPKWRRRMRFLRWALFPAESCLSGLVWLEGIAIHLLTVVAVYDARGLWTALLALVAPILSTLVLLAARLRDGHRLWDLNGRYVDVDPLNGLVLAWVLLLIARIVLHAWFARLQGQWGDEIEREEFMEAARRF